MADTIPLQVKRLDPSVPLPQYAYPGDAGLDLVSTVDAVIEPHCRILIPTGLALAIPEGYAGFVQPRSGLAARAGLSLVNTPGLIDSHYRGEIVVIAINLDAQTSIEIKKGDRIAQLVIQATPLVTIEEVETLDATQRGTQGFGSSGMESS